MYTDREEFEGWMERIMERFDRTEKLLERVLIRLNELVGVANGIIGGAV